MDNVAVSNRCLWDVTQMPAGSHWDLNQATEVRDPYEGSVEGYQLVSPHLRSMDLVPPSGTDFKSYATRWEERYSALIRDRRKSLTLFPVVSPTSFFSYKLPSPSRVTLSMFPVIGHYGAVAVEHILVRKQFATKALGHERTNALTWLVNHGIEVYVEENYPVYGEWVPFALPHNIGLNFFTVLADPEGRILAVLDAFGSEPGLESEDPLSYVFIAVELVALAKAGARGVFRIISRRAARRAAASAAASKAIKELTTEDLTRIVGGGPPNPGLSLATTYMRSNRFGGTFDKIEKILKDLETNFPEAAKEITHSYDTIPLQFRRSVTLQLQRHIETVIRAAAREAQRNPTSDLAVLFDVLLGGE